MVNINFVPDDYIHNNESRRTNVLYLILLVVVMLALGVSFVTIKIRQQACEAREMLVNSRMAQMQESMKQFDDLQVKRRAMMKTALTTAELLESVPRSILLASLTNNLPAGASLIKLNLIQKEPKQTSQNTPPAPASKYQASQTDPAAAQEKMSRERLLETRMEIEGMAPSDLQVASYIERLSNSNLLDNVALVESKEYKVNDNTLRQFKLTAMLKKEAHLTKEDVDVIREKARGTIGNF